MKVLLYSIDMVKGVEHLMPWRTLVEVAKHAPMETAICSAQAPDNVREYDGVKIYAIDYGTAALRQFVTEGGWDVLYYPIAFRQGLKDLSELKTIMTRKIAYVPGGLYPLGGSWRLLQTGEVKLAFQYLMDTITPHKLIASKLQKAGFEAIVCQAPLTAADAIRSGWKHVVSVLPGNSPMNVDTFDLGLLETFGLKGQKFVLFSGAPAPARGAVLAMKAFDSMAEQLPDTKMVMLMRRDCSSDFTAFQNAASAIKHKERFVISYEALTHNQLLVFFRSAWAVMLPFLIIPSEIPLTFFEVMAQGTPVITFNNGGTSDYLKAGLKIARRRTRSSFAQAIVEICRNEDERYNISASAREVMSLHPTWIETSKQWLSVL